VGDRVAAADGRRPLPAGAVAYSPFADLTLSGPSISALADHDPVVSRELLVLFAGSCFQDHDPTDWRVSPIHGDFEGFLRCSSASRARRSSSATPRAWPSTLEPPAPR
jgi:acetyl esterase/lipase